MADDSDDLASRLDRIEELLRRRAGTTASSPAGPEVRSARSIVGRIDDVWVAVTEGNERVVAAIGEATGALRPPGAATGPEAQDGQVFAEHGSPAGAVDPAVAADLVGRVDAALAGLAEERSAGDRELSVRLAGIEQAVGALSLREEPAARLDGIEAALAALAPPAGATTDDLGGRLDRIDERLAALAGAGDGSDDRLRRIEDMLARPDAAGPADEDTAVHLRLNRIEEALAGIAGRLGEPGAAASSARIEEALAGIAGQLAGLGAASSARIEEALAGVAGQLADAANGPDAAGAAAVVNQSLEAEIRRLTNQVEAIARALEASAARTGDGTLTDRLGRLRDQFRPR